MKISTPELKVVRFENEDVIATSLYILEDSLTTVGDYSYYVVDLGSMYSTADPGTWGIHRQYLEGQMDLEGYEQTKNEARDDVFYMYRDEHDGQYYTKGTSFYELYGQQ